FLQRCPCRTVVGVFRYSVRYRSSTAGSGCQTGTAPSVESCCVGNATVRILHVDPGGIDSPLAGGGPVRNFAIYPRLGARHEITVLTPSFAGSTREKMREGIRFVRLGRKLGDHGSSYHITFFFALPLALRQFDYDLLVEDFMPPMSVTLNPLVN